ncbi:MAG: YggU family protein [Deltaproteobacteria bacterium]|nr:YggU family protein [Deltaproteobacteria bacterium]
MALPPYMRLSGGELHLRVFVQPGAKKDEISGTHGNELKIKLAAPPVEGRANKRLVELLARLFKTKKSAITIKHGAASRKKLVKLEGVSAEAAIAALTC